MDQDYTLRGLRFRWDRAKASSNFLKHGVAFEEAAQVFFDPFVRYYDASAHGEVRDAAIGADFAFRVLVVVHLDVGSDHLRIVSAWLAGAVERGLYET